MSEIAERYNRIYTEREVTYGLKPEKIVQDILQYRTNGVVLEIGTGEGRNAFFLADQGFQVIAQDFSDVGLRKLKKRAEEKGLQLTYDVRDLRDIPEDEYMDVLVCTYVLQELPKEDALNVIKKMKERTRINGLHSIAAFTRESDFFEINPSTKNTFFEKDEMKNLYADWEILQYEEVPTGAVSKRADGTPMINTTAKIIARKKEA